MGGAGVAAQYVTTVEDATAEAFYGSRYVFSDLEQGTVSLDTRLDWTFTPTMSLELFLQPFFSSNDFSGEERVISSNDETLAPRRPGVVGLYLRTAMTYPPSKISIASPSARVTMARFSSGRLPFV